MISIGSNVRDSATQLQKTTVKYLADAIRNPRADISARIRQLRIVRQLDAAQYRQLKSQLPFFVCAMFNPPFRKLDNFAYTEYFIVDIDHLADKAIDMAALKSRLAADARVMLCFASPSNDGLKVMFRLSERCYDASLYKVFYHLFADSFSKCYDLEQVVDTRTCDVSRACFISVDGDAYYNDNSEPVRIKDFIDPEANPGEALRLKKEQEEKNNRQPEPAERAARQDIDKEALERIRKTLNPDSRISRQKSPAYVPEELNRIMDDLKTYVEDRGVEITEVVNINYGKKLRFKLNLKTAEVNLFFGKRGFTVVQTPRTGTDKELNALMADVVESFIVEKA